MGKLVSKTYGDALFSVAMEELRVDEFYESAQVIRNSLQENRDFCKLLEHPEIAKEKKVKMIEDSFLNQIPKEMVGLMILLVSKGRTSEILAVFEYFIDLVRETKRIGKASVTTAVPLSDQQKEKVEKKLLETTKYESFEMDYCVEPTLIGGMVIRIGDRVVDSSIKTKLYDLSRNLRNIQV